MTAAGLVDESTLDTVDSDVRKLIDQAVDEAKAAPEPSPDDLLTDVYVTY